MQSASQISPNTSVTESEQADLGTREQRDNSTQIPTDTDRAFAAVGVEDNGQQSFPFDSARVEAGQLSAIELGKLLSTLYDIHSMLVTYSHIFDRTTLAQVRLVVLWNVACSEYSFVAATGYARLGQAFIERPAAPRHCTSDTAFLQLYEGNASQLLIQLAQ
jgi:hypothetical protein